MAWVGWGSSASTGGSCVTVVRGTEKMLNSSLGTDGCSKQKQLPAFLLQKVFYFRWLEFVQENLQHRNRPVINISTSAGTKLKKNILLYIIYRCDCGFIQHGLLLDCPFGPLTQLELGTRCGQFVRVGSSQGQAVVICSC